MNCARCHDHFFDPISHKEYYQFRAFFEPHDIRTDRVPGQANPTVSGLVRVHLARLDAPTFLFIRGEENQPDKKKSLPPTTPGCLGGPELQIVPVTLPPSAIVPDKREFVIRETRDAAVTEAKRRQAEYAASQRKALDHLAACLSRSTWSALTTVPVALQVVPATQLAELEHQLAQGKKLTPFDAGPASIVPPASESQLWARESLIHVLFNHNEFITIR